MRPWNASLWGSRSAVVALLVLAALAPGCGRPPDENWLRVLQIEKDGVAVASLSSVVQTITASTKTRTVGAADEVDVIFDNQSTIVGSKDGIAGGVTVDQVRILYQVNGYALPTETFIVTYYVPAGTTGAKDAKLTVTLVSTALKNWLVDNIPASVLSEGLHASARLVFHARTDAGSELETEAGIGILFENSAE